MTVPFFSIIIPLYNSEDYIIKTLESISKQNFNDFEVIIINDGSTDNGATICENYCLNDQRFNLFNQSNQGVSSARNQGIKEANGKYLLFIDADDFIDAHYLETLQKEQLKYPESFIVLDFYKVDLEGEKNEIYNIKDQAISCYDFTHQFHITKYGYVASKIYDRSIVIENNVQFPENIKLAEDCIFFINYLRFIEKIFLSSYKGYYYQVIPNSAVSRKISMQDIFTLYDQIKLSLTQLLEKSNSKDLVGGQLTFWTKALFDNIYNLNLTKVKRIESLQFMHKAYHHEVMTLFSKSRVRGKLLKLSFQMQSFQLFDKLFLRFER
ncbi:glycosyltransferase family 2 protein [Sphingobacterium lactis]|uniref:Glycosyl transferase family 2 n=1 Tax=Sphingobacterium lactis TaxID=797291 RepID=A0A1H6CFL4_9SPHI|nr:glycosyltransferase family 2 protein [Sphingobacterium lactis]SEG71801.1 Glycosyl transferase family 2 [Sphingobacterium lactis]